MEVSKVKTVFVFNTGSSSVKISLLSLLPLLDPIVGDNEESAAVAPAASALATPIRILTAHAQRLGTAKSSTLITFSSTFINSIISENLLENDENEEEIGGGESQNVVHHHHHHHRHSLKLSSRLSSSTQTTKKTNIKTNINGKNSHTEYHHDDNETQTHIVEVKRPFMTHDIAIEIIINEINKYNSHLLSGVVAVGHRVVHGGAKFTDAVDVNGDDGESIIKAIENVSHLAPLHNPANLIGIQIGRELFKDIPQIAVFDTAFHSTIPMFAYTYPIPKEYAEHQIRKYGFHGTSVKYVSHIATRKLQQHFKDGRKPKIIIAHLGNGASVTAVKDGKSTDTTMEFTPLSGVMMGTRSGSIDPTIVTFAADHLSKSPEEVISDLNRKSGLFSISNGDNDMRCIERRATSGDEDAELALTMFVYILAKHIAAMVVACGGSVDALIFTAGIGENSAFVRKKTVEALGAVLGNVVIDDKINMENGRYTDGIISRNDGDGSPFIIVIPTDEELSICQECRRFIDL